MARQTRRRKKADAGPKIPKPVLRMVKQGATLLWPENFEERFRARHPYVVDLNGPCEAEFLAGQERKLRELTKDEARKFRKATAIEADDSPTGRSGHQALARIRTAGHGEPAPEPAPVEEVLEASAEAAAEEVSEFLIAEPDTPEGEETEDE